MTIEEQLKALMIEKAGSVNKFAHDAGLSTSMNTLGTYGHILKEDAREAASIIDLTFERKESAK